MRGDREVSGSSVCEGVCEAPTFTEWSTMMVPTYPEDDSRALKVYQEHQQVARVAHQVPTFEIEGTIISRLRRPARPGLAGASEPARLPRADPLPAHALPPGGPFGAPGPRVSVRARNYLTGTHGPHAVEGHHLNGTEPQHPNLTTLTKITRRWERPTCCRPST